MIPKFLKFRPIEMVDNAKIRFQSRFNDKHNSANL